MIALREQTGDRGFAAGVYSRVVGKLGVPRIRSDSDLAVLVEKRLPALTAKSLIQSGFSDAEFYYLVIPLRTLAHRNARYQSLSRGESNKAVRGARVTSLAEQVFGEPDRAWRWLRKAQRQFGGKSPVGLLATEAGARLGEEMVVQIEDGTAA